MLGRLKGSRDSNYLMLPLDLVEPVNLRDEHYQLMSALFVRSEFARFHPFLLERLRDARARTLGLAAPVRVNPRSGRDFPTAFSV